jgi:hypothetical protein
VNRRENEHDSLLSSQNKEVVLNRHANLFRDYTNLEQCRRRARKCSSNFSPEGEYEMHFQCLLDELPSDKLASGN